MRCHFSDFMRFEGGLIPPIGLTLPAQKPNNGQKSLIFFYSGTHGFKCRAIMYSTLKNKCIEQ